MESTWNLFPMVIRWMQIHVWAFPETLTEPWGEKNPIFRLKLVSRWSRRWLAFYAAPVENYFSYRRKGLFSERMQNFSTKPAEHVREAAKHLRQNVVFMQFNLTQLFELYMEMSFFLSCFPRFLAVDTETFLL